MLATMAVSVTVLASGSKGNCTLVSSSGTRLLIDAGLSCRELLRRLLLCGHDACGIDAILITHEHTDHVAGLRVLARRLKIPVYITASTYQEYQRGARDAAGHRVNLDRREVFSAGSGFQVGDITVTPFTIPHDAIDPVGFCFRTHGIKIGIVTDLGYLPDSIKFHLRGTDLLVLESNHDLEMLKVGPYPWSVKQRVMGRKGHLSNDVVSDFIRIDLDSSISTLVLGHLSEHNNHPEIVRNVAGRALDKAGRALFTRLVVAEPKQQTEVFTY